MKSYIALSITLWIAPLCVAQKENAKAVEQEMQTAVDQELVVGIAGGIIKNDTLLWTNAAGFIDKDSRIAFTPNSISRIASITKPLTAVAVMQLVEQGKANLDAPMATYVKEFEAEEFKEITVRQVLQHSAGLQAYKNSKEAANKKQYDSTSDALAFILDKGLRFAPGTDFYYSSYGYVALGVLIERISGVSYQDYLKEHIFNPAGMTQTSVEEMGETPEEKSKIYHQVKPGKIKEITDNNLSDRTPGGGVQSTVNDLLKFGNAVLNHTLISAESTAELMKSSGLKKEGNAYGMGWYLYGEHPELGTVVGHNGEQYGCSSFLFLFPDQNMVSVIMANTSRFEKHGYLAMLQTQVARELLE